MVRYLFLFFCLNLTLLTSYGQGKLERTKDNFEKPKSKKKTSSSQSNTSNYSNDDDLDDNDSGALFWALEGLFKLTYYIAVKGPEEISPFILSEDGGKGFNKYPFYDDFNGQYLPPGEGDKNSLLRAKIGYISNVTDIHGINGQVKFFPIPSISFDYNLHQYFEQYEGTNYSFGLNHLMLSYHRIRTDFLSFHYSMGVMFYNEQNPFSLGIGGEIFPIKPISIEYEQIWSFNNSNTISSLDLQVKYHIKRAAIYIAYHRLKSNDFPVKNINTGIQVTF